MGTPKLTAGCPPSLGELTGFTERSFLCQGTVHATEEPPVKLTWRQPAALFRI